MGPGMRLRPGSGLSVEQGITCQPPQYRGGGAAHLVRLYGR